MPGVESRGTKRPRDEGAETIDIKEVVNKCVEFVIEIDVHRSQKYFLIDFEDFRENIPDLNRDMFCSKKFQEDFKKEIEKNDDRTVIVGNFVTPGNMSPGKFRKLYKNIDGKARNYHQACQREEY